MDTNDSGITAILVLLPVLGLLGEGITRLTNRMAGLRQTVRFWAAGLGLMTAVLYFLVACFPREDMRSPTGVIGGMLASAMVGATASIGWYFIVSVITFLLQYVIAAPIRFLLYSSQTGQPRFSRASLVLLILGAIFGFVAGVFALGKAAQADPHISARTVLSILGLYTVGCACAPWFVKYACKIFVWGFSWAKSMEHESMERRRESSRIQQIHEGLELEKTATMKANAAVQADREEARQHLIGFYEAHADLLAAAFPPALLDAFIYCDMPDSLSPAQLWAVCQKKIAEFQPIIVQEQAKKKADDDRARKRSIRVKQLDAMIRTCNEKIAHLAKSGLDAEFIEDETHGLLMKIRQLEEQKELLSTLGHTVDA